MENIIEIKKLTVTYDLEPVLFNVNMSIPKGVLMAIVGPNGAGKSTLIKTMIDLIKPIHGDVKFNNLSYRQYKKEIAYVPQRTSVDWDFPTTVIDVVEMGRYGHVGWIKKLTKKDKTIALDALTKVGIYDLKDRQISELSGGQQQRVFLARALAQEAEIYLMDEPFQGVDIKTEKAIVELLKNLKKNHKTVIVVHHDLETVPKYFDYVTLLNTKVVGMGSIEEVFTKENLNTTYMGYREEENNV